MKTSGIYCILNTANKKFYIGSSNNIELRFRKHLESLSSNRHKNKYLQSAWNKYAKGSFLFSIIEVVYNKNLLINREQLWINYTRCYDRTVGYNICSIADRPVGLKCSEERKQKVSEFHTGKIISDETKAKMSAAHKGKTNRNLLEWPHADGKNCKCDMCTQKKKNYMINWKKNNPNYWENYYKQRKHA